VSLVHSQHPAPSRRAAVTAALVFFGSLTASAAGPLQNLAEVKELPRTLVAEGSARKAETALTLSGYRVERAALPAPQRVVVNGRTTDVSEAWIVTLRFERALTVRDQAFSLVIDGRWCGFLQEAPNLLSADAVCFDASLIREGAAVGATYRSIEIASTPEAERTLGPHVRFVDGDEAVHYSSARLHLGGAR
jgi:hypothetical protein